MLRYQSWKVAWTFFATCLLLLSLQIVYGFIMGFAHMGYDVLHEWIPFNAARATHTNLLVVWLLAGFMGSAYYIIPDEAETELWSMPLAWVQWGSLVIDHANIVVTLQLARHKGYAADSQQEHHPSSSPGAWKCRSLRVSQLLRRDLCWQ